MSTLGVALFCHSVRSWRVWNAKLTVLCNSFFKKLMMLFLFCPPTLKTVLPLLRLVFQGVCHYHDARPVSIKYWRWRFLPPFCSLVSNSCFLVSFALFTRLHAFLSVFFRDCFNWPHVSGANLFSINACLSCESWLQGQKRSPERRWQHYF